MVTLKIGDKIRCKHFVYVRDLPYGFIFDYRNYWFNEDGSWNKDVIPREEMEGKIKDDPTNADAWFEVIDVEEAPGGRVHNDIIEPYSLYLLRKVGDNSHPRITIATDGIDGRYFNLELVEIDNTNNMKTKEELKNNPWADAHKYADNKYHMEQGDHISKYERYEEVKEAFEAGYRQALEDYADKIKDDNAKK